MIKNRTEYEGGKTVFEEAAGWLLRGYGVIPCRDKKPFGYLLPRDGQGRPGWEIYKTMLPNLIDLYRWFEEARCPAYGIITGWNNLAVLDFDDLGKYFDWARDCWINTYQVKTGRGVHVYLKVKGGAVNPVKTAWGDIKAGGGYVLGAGSRRSDGVVYQAWVMAEIAEVEDLNQVVPGIQQAPPAYTQYQASKRMAVAPVTVPMTEKEIWDLVDSPRMGEDLITRIKREIDILSLLPDAISTGKGWFIARCPWHDDHHPSLSIDRRRGICKCLAGCFGGKCLDVINITALSLGIDDREAIEVLRRCL